ncbi:putative 15 kDa heat shock protein [Marinithermofilum abyssi]|uniref:Putative 15 kDa heat shock protein n=1 Tax=Marinithermofilum abyssi TaxID=1571185 RepID=A0A8J2VJD5_9BACL|nr:Hsp20/alpha crystallin family protein [Marinithermofilum abyssi]GGE27039.1 putative 15 kDa heat shock protein [Marinithermofilum abyssi]
MNQDKNFEKWSKLARKFLGDDFWGDMMEAVPTAGPKADVYHGQQEVVVLIDLPGIENVKDVDVRIDGDTLWVKGERPNRYAHYNAKVTERNTGAFERKIHLGALVSKKQSSASYRKGVLEIRLRIIKPNDDHIQVSDI